MLKEKEDVIRKALILFDALLISAVFAVTFVLRRYFHLFYGIDFLQSAGVVAEMSATLSDYYSVLLIFVPLWCIVMYLNGMYKSLRTRTVGHIFWIIAKSAFFTTITFGTIVFVFRLHFVSRIFFIMLITTCSAVMLAEKLFILYVVHLIRKSGYNYRNLLIVGTGRRAMQFIKKVERHREWGLRIIGALDYENIKVGSVVGGSVYVLGSLSDLSKVLHEKAVDEVVFVIPRSQLGAIENYLYVCETLGVKATIAVDLFDLKISRLRQTEFDGVPLITFETAPSLEWALFLKRATDIIVSGAGIIVLSIPMLVVMALIKLTSPGPVFFQQKRVGLNGRKFVLYKFRSMYKNAHLKLSELAEKNEMKGPVFKMKDDPRVTPFGKFLRKTSIDELPQLFNVFMGQMSLVGPRPPLPSEVSQYEPWQRRRLSMRPGITCLWQVGGRSEIGFEDWMKLDLRYIDSWSLWLDIRILFKTIPVVIFGRGAY